MTDNPQPSSEFRECRKCGETKRLEYFAVVYSKSKRGQNYRQHTCKECAKEIHAGRMRKARKMNPEKYRIHQREHRAKHLELVRYQRTQSGFRRKLRVMNAYGGPMCVCCGETILSALTIDHINNDGNIHRNELNKGRGREVNVEMYCWLENNNFPIGFQVLCYNCNISKHRNKGVCEHKLGEGSTTRAEARSLEAIAKRNVGRPYQGR
jgi:hypothetical protein